MRLRCWFFSQRGPQQNTTTEMLASSASPPRQSASALASTATTTAPFDVCTACTACNAAEAHAQLVEAQHNLETAARIGSELVSENEWLRNELESVRLKNAASKGALSFTPTKKVSSPFLALSHPDHHPEHSVCVPERPTHNQPHPARDDHPLVAALQRENSALLQQNSGLNARIARLERQLSDARDGNDHLITRISELDADKQRLRKTVRDLRTEAMRSKRKESNQPPSQSNHSPFSHSCDESSTTPTPSKIYPTLVTSSALSLESPLRVAFMPPRPYPLSATNSNSYSVDHPIVNSPISSVPDSPSIISGVLSLKHQLHQAQVESQLKDALSTIQSLTGMLSVSDTALESALLENGHLREELGRVNEVSEDLRLTVEELRMQQLEQDTNTSMAGLEDSVVDGSLWLDRESGEEGPLDASDQKLALVDVFQDQQDINQTALKGSEEQGQEVDISGLYETAPQSMMHSFGEDDDLVLPSTPISALRSFVSIAPSMSLLDELKSSTGSHLEKAMPATLASSSSLMRTSTPQLQHPSSSTFSSSHSNVTPSRISRADRRRVSPGTLPIGLGLAYDTTCEVRIPRLGSVAAVASQIANSPQEGPLRILDCARIEGVRDASFEGRSDSGICVVDGRRKMEEAGWTLEARDGRVGVLFAAVALAVDYCTKNFG